MKSRLFGSINTGCAGVTGLRIGGEEVISQQEYDYLVEGQDENAEMTRSVVFKPNQEASDSDDEIDVLAKLRQDRSSIYYKKNKAAAEGEGLVD